MSHTHPLAAVSIAILCLLAGCAGLGGNQTTAATPEQTVSPTEAPTASPTTVGVDETATATSPPAETTTPTSTTTERPQDTETATPTETAVPTEESVVVEGGTLSVDADRVYEQSQSMLGTDVEAPTVRVTDEMPFLERYERGLQSDFTRTFGFGDEFINTSVYHGTASPDGIVVMPKNATRAETEMLLAHEFTHWLQFHSQVLNTRGYGGFADDHDSAAVVRGLVEGGSVFIVDEYVDRYMDTSFNQTDALGAQYERGTPARRVFRGPYYFGALYLHGTVDEPANLSWAYDPSSPTPETTEQLLHGHSPAEEPELPLSVTANGTGNWSLDRPASHGITSRGELGVRTMLRIEHNRSVAARAAAGWGTDRLARFTHSENQSRIGYAWVMRWDTSTDADEFERAFDSWMAANDDPSVAFHQRRLGDDTVVVVAGDPAFVGNVTVEATDDNVTVATAG